MSRYLIDLGFIKIYWYSVLILTALLIGMYLLSKEIKKIDVKNIDIYDLLFKLLIVAVLGARLYYVVFNFEIFRNNLVSIFYIWEGGIAIYGAVIASLIYIYFYAKKKKISFLRITDLFIIPLILGQAIGRWGNFFNQEAYGPMTSLSFLKGLKLPNFIIQRMYIDGNYYVPTFLYESLWCLLGFVLLILIRRYFKLRSGQLTWTYFIWYGIGRFFIEGLRQDSLYFFGVRVSQIVSILLVLIGIWGFIKFRKSDFYRKDGQR